jgi:hypothetical protein
MLEDTGNFVLRATAVVGLTANGRVDASWMVYTGNEWMPGADATFDIGRSNFRVRDLWLSRLTDYTALASAPATPATGHVITYAKTDKLMYQRDDAGVETLLAGAAGLSNPMTTAGDLIVGGASGTPTRLAAVATGTVLASAGVGTAPTWSASPAITDLKLGGGAIGTSGVGVLALGPSTEPTTSPVDTVQLYTSGAAGSRSLVIRDERGGTATVGSVLAGPLVQITSTNAHYTRLTTSATTAGLSLNTVTAGGREWQFTSYATGGPRGATSFTISRAGAEIMSWNSGDAWYAYFANIGSMRVLQAGAVDSAGTGNRAVYVLN